MKFKVSVPSLPPLGNLAFSKITGIGQEAELIEYREGDETLAQHKIPGLIKTSEATFERGVAHVSTMEALTAWKEAASTALAGPVDGLEALFRHNVHVQVMNRLGAVEWELALVNAWPRSIEYGDLDANASDIWVARIMFVYEVLAPGEIPAAVATLFAAQ
jgi:phage tail-like protein